MEKSSAPSLSDVVWYDPRAKQFPFDPNMVKKFVKFKRGKIIVGAYYGDEGKGKETDIIAQDYKKQGLKVLSIRGQGSGNAGHTVVVDGEKFHFNYLTSAGLSADIMLMGAGMLIDPIRLMKEAKQLTEEQRSIIMVAERATIVCDVERAMDEWYEDERSGNGQEAIGTTKSGVGPGTGNRANKFNVTFADALKCKSARELQELYFRNPLIPKRAKEVLTEEYAERILKAVYSLNVVNSEEVISNCRTEQSWAIVLEVSQAVCLDPLFGNSGHFTTSMHCTDTGAVAGAGLTMRDFSDGTMLVAKAYGSKVGGGPYITKFTDEEKHIADFIDNMVGEHGVTTGRKRDLGWFDAPAIRHSIELTGARDICINCMDVIAALTEVTDFVKICYAYQHIETRKVEYGWPYHQKDYKPLYLKMPIAGKSKEQIISEYIALIERVIGREVTGYGVGPSRNDYVKKTDEAMKIFLNQAH